MKKLFLLLLAFAGTSLAFAQNSRSWIVGTYDQKTIMAPDELKDAEADVEIMQDPTLSKKIWIKHLISGERVYALLHTNGEDALIYKVPAQTVGGYLIQFGCVVFNKDLNNCVVALNNKSACFGMSQKDYDNGVIISKKGKVKAGNVDIDGTTGTVKTGSVDVNSDGVKVDTKKVMAGVQYVGEKIGGKKIADDDDADVNNNTGSDTGGAVKVKNTSSNVSVNKKDVKVNDKKIIIKNKKQN